MFPTLSFTFSAKISFFLIIIILDNGWGDHSEDIDNEFKIETSIYPYVKLHKSHNIFSYHFVCNIIPQCYINLSCISSEYSVADALSKIRAINPAMII